jgi:hypothetical protein
VERGEGSEWCWCAWKPKAVPHTRSSYAGGALERPSLPLPAPGGLGGIPFRLGHAGNKIGIAVRTGISRRGAFYTHTLISP